MSETSCCGVIKRTASSASIKVSIVAISIKMTANKTERDRLFLSPIDRSSPVPFLVAADALLFIAITMEASVRKDARDRRTLEAVQLADEEASQRQVLQSGIVQSREGLLRS